MSSKSKIEGISAETARNLAAIAVKSSTTVAADGQEQPLKAVRGLTGGAQCNDDITWRAAVTLFFSVFLPSAVMVMCFSALGYGLDVFNAVGDRSFNRLGNVALFCCWCWLGFLFVFDYPKMGIFQRMALGSVVICLLTIAAVLKGLHYPWAPMVFTHSLAALAIGNIRIEYCPFTKHRHFYGVVGGSAIITSVIILAVYLVWIISGSHYYTDGTMAALAGRCPNIYEHVYSKHKLDYEVHCGPQSDLTGSTKDEAQAIEKACNKARKVWFLAWLAPVLAVLWNIGAGLFCHICGRLDVVLITEALEKRLKTFVGMLVCFCTGMYTAVYASGTSTQLGSTFMAFGASALAVLMIWSYLEVDPDVLASLAKKSKIGLMLTKAWQSDWTRAVAIGSVNILLPMYVGADILRQRIRRMRGMTNSSDRHTEAGRHVINMLSTWKWCSIFVKVNLLGELCVGLIIGSKLTFIFFSWLNDRLGSVDFVVVCVLVFFIGCAMFLLPPVPGTAVYLFAGVVLGAKSEKDKGVGFWPGVTVASMIGIIAKLLACCGQYGIGYAAGQSVKIQKFAGVDTVMTRAIEKILQRRGLDIAKVAILVGGPDWPTSVLCGILKLNIPQMLLGTLPVFIASVAPQTLAGALFTRTGSVWATVKTIATSLAAAAQAAATLTFTFMTLNLIEKEGEELARPRPEHEAVAELTKKEQAFNTTYKTVSDWKLLISRQKAVILGSVVLQLMGGFIFMCDFVTGGICFRPFGIPNKIEDNYANDGLNGNVLNIVIFPGGHAALGFFTLAIVLHVLHIQEMSCLAKRRLTTTYAEPTLESLSELDSRQCLSVKP